jgi:hypothetical protein
VTSLHFPKFEYIGYSTISALSFDIVSMFIL